MVLRMYPIVHSWNMAKDLIFPFVSQKYESDMQRMKFFEYFWLTHGNIRSIAIFHSWTYGIYNKILDDQAEILGAYIHSQPTLSMHHFLACTLCSKCITGCLKKVMIRVFHPESCKTPCSPTPIICKNKNLFQIQKSIKESCYGQYSFTSSSSTRLDFPSSVYGLVVFPTVIQVNVSISNFKISFNNASEIPP